MTPDKAKIVADFMCANIEREYATTRKVIAALPDDKMEWQPHEKGMKAGDLAWHIAGADCFFMTGVVNAGFPEYPKAERPKTVAEILKFYDATFPPLLEK